MTSKKDAVVEATATVIDNELTSLSDMDMWLSEQSTKVESVLKDFAPHTIVDASDYKQSKRERTAARKAIAEIEEARKAKTKAVKEAVRDFETKVRDLLEPLSSIDANYKAEIELWEEQAYKQKLSYAREAYEDMAPALVDLVPFERICDKYSKDEGWDKLTVTDEKVRLSVEGHISQIANDEKTIDAMGLDADETSALKADYFSCLDLGDAMRRSTERRQQRERVAALEAERKVREEERARLEAEMAAQAEQMAVSEPMAAQNAPQQATQQATKPMDTGSVMTPEQYEAITGEVPNVAVAPAPQAPQTQSQWAFCGYCTQAQASELQEFCARIGISRIKAFDTHGKQYILRSK
ncbi:MAG: DUF1351 domain-containing protein [Atopobium minutum]|uniref:DUF1351 domain-containing protein n=1 Tax=Atopobium minutum TaxID=1381 RepID=UPI001D39DAF9|nr:DUF1351 domain-containing protein [Atopobium minutum]MBS4874135.1 DUF1351 domain-containing protein [Atopobium minutum]